MEITITTKLTISEENIPLIQVVADDLDFQQWKKEQGEEDSSAETFIKQYLERQSKNNLKSIITPSIYNYFGKVMKTQADEAVNLLESGAIEAVVTIER